MTFLLHFMHTCTYNTVYMKARLYLPSSIHLKIQLGTRASTVRGVLYVSALLTEVYKHVSPCVVVHVKAQCNCLPAINAILPLFTVG